MKKSGFTLVELLVVVAIIIIMSTVAMLSYASSGKKTRDSRRMADLEKIRLALEMVRQVGNTYPATANVETILVPTYLQSWPSGPKGVGDTYVYTRDATSNYKYTLNATMEETGSVYQVTNL